MTTLAGLVPAGIALSRVALGGSLSDSRWKTV
jgi:hypothetical protein